MAGGSVTVAALRHRPRQAILVVLLSAVVTAAAALGPLYARAVEQSVLRNVVADAPTGASGIFVSASGSNPLAPARLARAIAPETPPQFGRAVGGADTRVLLSVSPDGDRYRARLVSRAALCRHLTMSDGRCASDEGEVVVSRRTADAVGLRPGQRLRVVPEGAADPDDTPATVVATVVGVYEAVEPSDPYWSGRGQTAAPATRPGEAAGGLDSVDDVLTSWSTLAAAEWPQLRTHLDIPLVVDRVDLEGVPALQAATDQVDRQARTVGASATSGLAPLLASTQSQRDQARTVIPLLTVQLAVLGIVVLAFVCAAATEQRRPEIALARLRGLGTGGAAGLLLRELGILVLLGVVLGAGLGWLTALGATALWLEPGVTLEARWPVGVAVVAAAVAGLLAIAAAGAPTLRQPLTALLRRVPPRASTLQVGLVEGAIVAAAAAGLVTLLSGDGGPVALLAPGLLAIAGGLLLAQAAIPTAGPLARRSLRRGDVPWALAGVQIARRPALRRLIAIVTVACALLVFAVDAWTVSDRNRNTRADVEAGAPVVLTVDADSSLALREAVLDIDPEGRFATPVVTVRSATETGPRTTAVEPDAFLRVARWGSAENRPTVRQLRQIRPHLRDPIELRGDQVSVTARFEAEGIPPAEGLPRPQLAPMRLVLGVADAAGIVHRVDLGRLTRGTSTYSGELPCADGCLLREVSVTRTFGDFTDAAVSVELTDLRAGAADALRPVDLDTEDQGAWQSVPWYANGEVTGLVSPGAGLNFRDESYGVPATVQHGDVPVFPPALTAGQVPEVPRTPGSGPGPQRVVSSDLTAGDLSYRVMGTLPQVPRSGPRGVLVDLAAVVAGPSVAPAQTSYDVWLAADDPTRERQVRDALRDRGLEVTARDSAADHRAAFADEGPTLALRLAVLAGLVAVVLAAAVLVVGVATSGASRARDLAGLRVVGVPAHAIRAAAVREHLVVAVLGVLAGALLGVAAAQAALPIIPLFATPSARLPLVLEPAWPAVAATVVGCLLLLCAVSVVVGRALAASATPDRLRESR